MGQAGHFTPRSLGEELARFRKLKGYLPRVVLIHLPPLEEPEVATEVKAVARELGASITLGREGMRLRL